MRIIKTSQYIYRYILQIQKYKNKDFDGCIKYFLISYMFKNIIFIR